MTGVPKTRSELYVLYRSVTKSQRKALNRVTGLGALPVLGVDAAPHHSIIVKVGSPHSAKLYAITARGRVDPLD